jgi:membrane protein YfhO
LVSVTIAPSRRADVLAVAVLLLLPLLFAALTLAGGRTLSPVANLFTSYPWQALGADAGAPNPALSDVTQWFHPVLLWSAGEVRAGRLPLWMPTAYAGVPFFANPQTALLFPLTWLAWILPAAAALTLITVLKLAGAGVAAYWFLRGGLALTVPAALIGSLGFEFSTTLVGWAGWAFGSEIMFLPLLFAGVERVRAPGARRWTVALAVIIALAIVAGYPQGAFHALLAAGAWALARARGADRGFLARGLLAAALGAGLAAVQVLPFLEYLRASAVYAYRTQWMAPLSVPPAAAITLALPYAFGSGRDAWGPWQFNIASTYVGLVPLLLVPLGARAGWRRPGGRFFILYMLIVAAVHYGLPGGAQIATLPGLSLGANLRLMPHLDFAICVLGALGADALARKDVAPPGWTVRLALVAIALAAFGWVAAHHDAPGARGLAWSLDLQFGLALAGLTLAALLALRWLLTGTAGWGVALVALQALSVVPPALAYLPRAPAQWLYPDAPALAWLRARAGIDRVVMPGHVGPLYGLAEAHGYDGLTPRRIAELIGSVGTGTALVHGYLQNPLEGVGSEALSPVAVLASPVVDLLGVRYVMLPPGAAPIWPHLTLAYEGRDARVFVNEHALPRAFLVFRARCAHDDEALWAIRGRRVDARTEVVLADCATPPAAGPGGGVGAVDVRAYQPARVRLVTDSEAPALLVLTDTWYPGWRARVDGRPATLWRADYAFRAVAVPAGRHAVELRFAPRSVVAGAALSALAAALAVALLAGGRRRAAP